MKIIFIFLLFSQFLYANAVINIESDDIKITEFEMAYFVDDSHNLDIDAIIAQKFSGYVPNKISLGSNKNHVWYKIEVKNSTDSVQELFVHMKNAYINSEVDIYEIKDSSLFRHVKFDIDNDENISKLFYGSTLRYKFLLNTNSTKTIYIKLLNNYRQFSNIVIYDSYNSIIDFTKNNLLSVVLISILLILAVYHMVLFCVSRHMEYIYYSLALFFAVIFQSRELGIAANFGMHGEVPLIVSSAALILFMAMFLIFAMTVFDLKKYNKLSMFFKTTIVLLGVNLIFLFTPIYQDAIVFIANLAALAIAAEITLAVYVYLEMHPLAKHYIAANIFFIIFSVIALLFYEGFIPYNEITFRSISIGCVIEAIIFAHMLSYMISHKLKILEEENLEQKDKIIKKSEKEQLGEMISVIAHQLKQPLNIISMSISKFELFNMTNKDIKKEECDELFSSLLTHINFANSTIDEFRHFFNPNKKVELIDLNYPITISSELMRSPLRENDVKLEIDIDIDTKIKTFGTEIVQVLLNLIKNSNEHFKETQEDKSIKIIAYEDDNNAYIQVKDNAGGVPENIIDKIFDQYFSTKNEEEGTGLGLDLCKYIIEKRCHGNLSFKNEDNGAVFTIRLPKIIL